MKHLSMAIVVKDGKVLVQERFRASKGMVVEFPGGQVNHNESGTDAAIRELYEETTLKDLTHVATFSDINEYGGRIYYTVLKADSNTEPKVVEDVDQQSFKWLNPSELPLSEFYAADQNFISKQLPEFC
ncbi:MutT/nudix family protein [Vibrio sinaloensis DSM 21326]|uniref:MutT/nudix family protein n=1 Tax=Vibrio sinaloensis DSM 21326 TaxID=945550 RepID=E8M5R9_PHOS4|nr:NUDIX hydrolase [Vibrio sinaloensis]EGA70641.1 MutT/nudix family protein [Vibrio sinaloensis DSM 21326]MDN3685874.1 NUDIX hydrolase [Vibrio sinaloensis]